MAVAKQHRRGKPKKTEQRKGRRTGVRTLGKTTFLASPIYIGQAQGEEKKTHKNRSQNWTWGLLFASFGSAHPYASRMYFPLLSK